MATKRRGADQGVQLKLRLTESLRQQLETLAAEQHRSINGQIIHLLERGVRAEGGGEGESGPSKYRRNAAQVLEAANAASSPERKRILLDMAQNWIRLAEQRERSIEAAARAGAVGDAVNFIDQESELAMPPYRRPRRA